MHAHRTVMLPNDMYPLVWCRVYIFKWIFSHCQVNFCGGRGKLSNLGGGYGVLMFCGRAKISFAASKVEFDIEQKVQLDIFEGTFWCLVSLVSQTRQTSLDQARSWLEGVVERIKQTGKVSVHGE